MRIAAEEPWAPAALLSRYRDLLQRHPASWDPGFRSLWGFFLGATPRATQLVARIQDLGAQRLADMDASGIAKQLVIGPFLPRGLDGAIYGFAVETGLHLLRIIVAGVFDRFPRLKMLVGHLGEGLPFWLLRLDFRHRSMVSSRRYEGAKPLRHPPSHYLRENVWVTTSGMQWAPAILFSQQVLGMDRVLYAMDYPYQFVPEEVKVTDELPISDEDKRKLYRTNAERVFRL